MFKRNRRVALASAVMAVVGAAACAPAQVAITGSGTFTYTQNFDSLPTANSTWANNSTLANWYIFNSTGNSGTSAGRDANPFTPYAGTLYAASGSISSGGVYSYGNSSSTDRALGALNTNTLGDFYYGVQFTNNTAQTINSITIGFTAEQWRREASSTTTQDLLFEYAVDAPSFESATGFTSVADLTFVAPQLGAGGGVDGNTALNRQAFSKALSIVLAPGSTLTLRWFDNNEAGSDTGQGVDEFSFSAVIPGTTQQNLTWTTGNGNWSTLPADQNWLNSGSPASFASGDIVTFGDTGVGPVTIAAGGVSPSSTTVSNTIDTYTFSGGPIAGGGTLTKTGAGTLILSSANTYGGGTIINTGGIVQAASDAALGSPGTAISIDNGTLRAGGALNTTRPLSVALGGATIDTNGFDATFTTLTSAGAFVKQGAGKLTFTGAFANTSTTNVLGGTLALAQTAGTVTIVPSGGNAFAGNLDIAGPIRVNVNGGLIEGGGQVRFVASGATIGHAAAGVVTTTYNNNIVLNPDGLAQPFNAAITANSDNTAQINGVISGAGNLTFGNLTGPGGSGKIQIVAPATYTGATVINNGYPANETAAAGVLELGVDNALPVGTAVTFGVGTGNAGALDLRGHEQTIASLASAGTGTYIGITNTQMWTATLTINGSAHTTYSGPIGKALTSDLVNSSNDTIALVRDGTGSTKLTGANTYNSGTEINGGTLIISNTFTDLDGKSGTGTGSVLVNFGGTLAGSGRIAGSVVVSGKVSPGESAGSLLMADGVDFSDGGTYEWGLSALATTNPGVNFDQIVVSGGDVVLGGSAKFSIVFDGTATDPDAGNSFWNSPRTWKVLDNTGTTSGIFGQVLNGTYVKGNLTLRAGLGADLNDIFLDYVPLIAGARNLIWNGGGSAVGPTDTDGAWTSPSVWWDAISTSNVTFDSLTPDNATFGAGAGAGVGTPVTVTIPATATTGELVFAANSSVYTLTGGTLTLTGASAADLTADNSANIDSAVALGGPQTWTVNGANVLTVNGAISGAQSITKNGTGTLALTNATNGFSSITVTAGTLSPANDGAMGVAGATVTIDGGTFKPSAVLTSARPFVIGAGGGTFDTSTGDTTLTGVVSGGATTKLGAGVLTLDNASNSFSALTVTGADSLVRPTSEAALGAGAIVVLNNSGGLQLPDGFVLTRELKLEVDGAGGVIDVPTGNATLSSVVTGELFTKTGTGRLLVASPTPSSRTKNTNIKGGTLALASIDGSNGRSALGSGTFVASVAGTLEIANVKFGYLSDGSRPPSSTAFANIHDGGTLSGTGANAAITGTVGFAGNSGIAAPAAGDRLLIGSTVRNSSVSGQFPVTITVTGAGRVRLASGATAASGGSQYSGGWVLNMDQATGILSVGPVEPAGFGETLNALGYTPSSATGPGRPITVTSGTLAIGSDTWNNGATNTPMTNLVSVRNPITLDGGKIASTGYRIDNAATTITSGAVISTIPVAAKLAGDITVVGGKTSTVLLYDPVGDTGARDVHIMNDPNAAMNGSGNLSWFGTLELDPGVTTGGALVISRDIAATSAFVAVSPGAQITIKPGAALKLSGPGGTLSDGYNHVNIESGAAALGQGLIVDNGTHRVGSITGGGRVDVAGGTLTATNLRGVAASITGNLSIAPDGSTLGASKVTALTITGGKLDLANNSLVIAAGGATLSDIVNYVKVARGSGDWTGSGITSSTAAADSLKITGIGVIANTNEAPIPAPLVSDLDGQSASLNDVLVKYTYNGDSTFDGLVGADDYFQIDAGFISGGTRTGWRWGDYNYDGLIDIDDYFLIDTAYVLQSGPLDASTAPAPVVAAVPEPATLSLLALGAATLLRRRWK